MSGWEAWVRGPATSRRMCWDQGGGAGQGGVKGVGISQMGMAQGGCMRAGRAAATPTDPNPPSLPQG